MTIFGHKKISPLIIKRNKKSLKNIDYIIWIVPIILVHLSSILIAFFQSFLFRIILKVDILFLPKSIIILNDYLTDSESHRVAASSKKTFAVIESRDV